MMRWTMPAILLLAACSGGKDEQAAKDGPPTTPMVPEAAPAAPVAAQETPPPDYVADPAVKPPAKPDAGIGTGDAVIPAAVQGRWGLVAADCTSTRGDAKGLLTIEAADLRFYESHGILAHIRERGATRIVADYKFSGEGMEWDRLMQLTVLDGGKTLVRRDYGEGASAEPMRYSRCA
ncbi:MAG: hypothetical protein J0H88_04030 [Sphingomonadales bacterium]|nr:hypothetical protein [Sphingomonadales bacterium]